jgi:hypothetical protein
MTELSTLEKASYDAIAKIDVISSMQVVQIGKIAEKQENGILKLTLPNSTETYTLKVSRAEYYDATNFVWVGERIDNELVQIIDYFTLFNEKGMIGGDFRLGTHFAKIVPLSEKYQVIIEIKKTEKVPCLETAPAENPLLGCTMGTSSCISNILIVYPPEFVTEPRPVLYALGRSFVENLNSTFKRSNIKHRVKLVGVEPIEKPDTWQIGFNSDAPIAQAALQLILDQSSSNLSSKRKTTSADIVVVLFRLTDPSLAQFVGWSANIPATSEKNSTVSVDYNSSLSPAYAFTHEVGHLFGGRHEIEADPKDVLAHAYVFGTTNNKYSTMMHSVNNPILNFSNPDVTYLTQATGTSKAFNACRIQENGCNVSKIVANPKCTIKATGTFNKAMCPTTLTLKLQLEPPNTCNTPLPPVFNVESSTDGINFKTVCNSVASTCSIPVIIGIKDIYVKITAANPLPFTPITSTVEWYSPTCIGTNQSDESNTVSSIEKEQSGKISIQPNVTDDLLNAIFELEEAEDFAVQISDTQGKVYKNFDKILVKEQMLSWNIKDLASGLYLLNLKNANRNVSLKFIKL